MTSDTRRTVSGAGFFEMMALGLMEYRGRSSRSFVQALCCTLLVCCACHATMDVTPKRLSTTTTTTVDVCPVRLRTNISTGATDGVMCACYTSSINEIRCSGGLVTVPEFLPSDHVFHALYLSRQNISEVIQGSFANLRVSLTTE